VPLSRPIADYESVADWGRGLREQWGGDPLAEEPEKLASLAAFCELIEKDPDELLAFCFLRKKATGERFGSVKRREQVLEQLRRYRERCGPDAAQARRRVNDVLSFLIHGGVLIHPGMI
jgi:hypothetical protein